MRIAFVTTELGRVHQDVDRPFHERSFAGSGATLEFPSWRDPGVDWSGYDLAVIRSTWDYVGARAEFAAWLGRAARAVPIHNPEAVIRWNLDKRYLRDLAERGVPTIPTRFAETREAVEAALERHGDAEVVVKPVVSAGSRHTGRFRADDPAARALAQTIRAEGLAVMVQPFATSVAEGGELAVVCFDGEPAHAFRKGPLLASGGGLLGGTYQERIRREEPDEAHRRAAAACAEAVRAHCAERLGVDRPLLYARYDLVRLDDGSPALLEAELFEPAFFLNVRPEAADPFRDAVLRRAEV